VFELIILTPLAPTRSPGREAGQFNLQARREYFRPEFH